VEEATTSKPSESIKSKEEENLVQRAAKQPSPNKPQNHACAAPPPKSAKLLINTFNIFNFKKWPVTASGWSGWG
jgi:hypothetical protein